MNPFSFDEAVSVCLQRHLLAGGSTPAWPSFSSCLEDHPMNPSSVLVCVFTFCPYEPVIHERTNFIGYHIKNKTVTSRVSVPKNVNRSPLQDSMLGMLLSWASAVAAALPNLFAFRRLAGRPVKHLGPARSQLHGVAWWPVTGGKVAVFNGDNMW